MDLPLNGRNYLQLASLAPGATTNGPASSQGQQRMGGARNTFALNVAGQRVHYNHLRRSRATGCRPTGFMLFRRAS